MLYQSVQHARKRVRTSGLWALKKNFSGSTTSLRTITAPCRKALLRCIRNHGNDWRSRFVLDRNPNLPRNQDRYMQLRVKLATPMKEDSRVLNLVSARRCQTHSCYFSGDSVRSLSRDVLDLKWIPEFCGRLSSHSSQGSQVPWIEPCPNWHS